jgi:ribonuclease P protein component
VPVPSPRLRFRRRHRVRRRRDFERAFREGSRARGAILLVVVAENGLGETRLGLSVGRSVWREAVRRNRVRRVFREAFRLSRPELPDGLDVVLVPAVKALEPELEATRRELVALVRKAHRRLRERGAVPPAPERTRPAGGAP